MEAKLGDIKISATGTVSTPISWLCPVCGITCSTKDLPHVCPKISQVMPNKQDEILSVLSKIEKQLEKMEIMLRSR